MSNVIKFSTYSSLIEKKMIESKWNYQDEVQPIHNEELDLNDSKDINHDNEHHIREVKEQAVRLIEEAKIEAENLIKTAQREIAKNKEEELKKIDEVRQQLLEEAHQEGYSQGYQLGLKQGKDEGFIAYQAKIEQANMIIKQAELERKEKIQTSEPFIIELTIEIAKKIIHSELNQDRELIVKLVKETLKLSSELKEIAICVHPNDLGIVKDKEEELKTLVSSQANLIILPDLSIQSGGCMIRTSFGSLDARIDTQLEEVRKTLLDIVKGSDEDRYGTTSQI